MHLFEVKNLKKHFPIKRGFFRKKVGEIKAVDDVSFSIDQGQIVALVGESGSGKSTAATASIRLTEPTSGKIFFLDQEINTFSPKQLQQMRQEIQMVFQNPYNSLNPRKSILDNMGNSLLYHKRVKNEEEKAAAVEKLLKQVGLPRDAMFNYPHQFSGGQQQRISIGRALALHPKMIICDEAVSALDLSVQAEILNLLYDLKKEYKLSYLFITHDLSIVKVFCDTILVMYRGKIVERGPRDAVFAKPMHPYTQMLFSSTPKEHPRQKKLSVVIPPETGEVKSGCPFFARCPKRVAACEYHAPPMQQGDKLGHTYTCIH